MKWERMNSHLYLSKCGRFAAEKIDCCYGRHCWDLFNRATAERIGSYDKLADAKAAAAADAEAVLGLIP